MRNHMEEFKSQLAEYGLMPEQLIADGQIQRFAVNGNNKNGWYVLFCDSEGAGGAFGNWAEGLNETWTSESVRQCDDPERRARFLAQVEKSKQESEEKRKQAAEEAAKEANRLWNEAYLIEGNSHPYLDTKGIVGKALRLEAGTPNLLVPMLASGGHIVSVQRIMPDGSKRFLSGGNVKGACCIIKGETDRLYVCEGYATAESINMATGKMTFCAFNAGNLLSVCEQINKKTNAPIIVCGDNDLWSTNAKGERINAGWDKANACADNLGCYVFFPQFADTSTHPTDFNDLHCLEGLSAVTKQIGDIFDSKKKEVIESVKKWCMVCSGTFSTNEIDKDLSITTKEEKEYRTQAVMQLVDEGLVERDEHKRTIFRTRDRNVEVLNIFSADVKEEEIRLNFPFGIGQHAILSPRNIVTVQGENNAGKTSFGLEMLLSNLHGGTTNGREIHYISSEMSQDELKRTAKRFAPIDQFRGCHFYNRPFEPYDLIHTNNLGDDIVIIDFLETKGADYSKTVAEVQKIYESMRNGIAIIMVQKFAGKEYGKGGEGMLEKTRLAINMNKIFHSEVGSICYSKIVKCKCPVPGMPNIDGKSLFYAARYEGLCPLSDWGYMTQKGYENSVKDLKRSFGIKETESPCINQGTLDVLTRREGV